MFKIRRRRLESVSFGNKIPRFLDKFRKQRKEVLNIRVRLASARKWMWLSLAVIAVVIAVVAIKYSPNILGLF